jgi:hypothetical protein
MIGHEKTSSNSEYLEPNLLFPFRIYFEILKATSASYFLIQQQVFDLDRIDQSSTPFEREVGTPNVKIYQRLPIK